MGVPSLFAYLSRKYGQITFININTKKNVKSKLDQKLYFDFNCLIHPIINDCINEHLNSNIEGPLDLSIVFTKILNYTNKVISLIDNVKTVYIIFDGVAPRAKMNQQRIRRFLSVKNNSEERRKVFDTNCISPGTDFMNKLADFLRSSYHDNQKIIISDTLEAGEAEHKIMYIIKDDPEHVNNIIYGLDADLIMLSLACFKPIKLLRENTLNYNSAEFLMYHVSGVKKAILDDIYNLVDEGYHQFLNPKDIIKDFIYVNFFIGNDFMPGLKAFEIQQNGIDYIMSIYTELINKYNGQFKIINKFQLDNMALCEFLSELSDVLDVDNGSNNNGDIKVQKVNDKQYLSYIKTSLWVLKYYYLKKCPSFGWYYSYHYSPCLSGLIEYLQRNTVSSKFDESPAVSFEVQLLCILPKESKEIVSEKCRDVFDKFPKYYPDVGDYTIDLNGKKFEWQSTVILPFIKIEDIIDTINTI